MSAYITVYGFDQITREYLGPARAYADPKQPDRYALPANCREDAPPAAPERYAARATSTGWEVVEDHRGETWYQPDTREAVKISELGPVPEGLVAELPPPSLEDVRKTKLVAILSSADAVGQVIYEGYSRLEQDSWPEQRADALALLADPDAPAPLIRAMALARGISETELRDKVLANVERARTISAAIMGQQQARETLAKAALTLAGLEAIPDTPESYIIPEV
ncbi:hypothetical protein [Desulfocurvibacter africanus]|uniref:hypothetical protein n=1 Tax=Desulfocurvibacter africanus TaxID=873 RepID=UPI00040FD16A|nr:hypothetical protein [Desulfocurvibacter africanus]